MSFQINNNQRVNPTPFVEWGGGAKHVSGNNFFVQGTEAQGGSLLNTLNSMDNKLEGGHSGVQCTNNSNGKPVGGLLNLVV